MHYISIPNKIPNKIKLKNRKSPIYYALVREKGRKFETTEGKKKKFKTQKERNLKTR